MEKDVAGPVAHILVVGFHHKKGGQVEFCHPPISEGKPPDCKDLPPQWKHLPCLALPDGSHNYDKDTIYFLLPGRDETKSTMFGVACYKQMKATDLLQKSSEVTRGTVQKSVVVLTELPLFGLIDVKLQLITHAYFAERDFSKISILKEFFNSLNTSLPKTMSDASDSEVFIGVSLVELVKKFKHKTLILFKLLLLERRVLFFGSPVHSLCTCLLSVISLFPDMIQGGLTDAACPRYYKVKTPTVSLEEFGIKTEDYLNLELSHVPNYSHGGPNNVDLSRTSRQPSVTNAQRYPEGGRGQKLSRTQSCDSAVKAREESREHSQVDKSSLNISQNETLDDEDKLLDMIDEELFGTYFEEKREKLTRSLSEPDRTELGGDSTQGRLDRSDGACSPNEMSSLLSHDVDSPNEEADTGRKLELKQGFQIERDSIAANNNKLQSDSERSPSADEAGLLEGRSTDTQGESKRIEDVFTLPGKTPRLETELGAHGSAALESGISSLGSQQWEDDPASQTIDRQTSSNPRSSLSDFVVLPDLPSTPNLVLDDFGFPLSLFGKGSLFHPYMSLQQHDLLQDVSVRCFLVGASNVLFKHKRQIQDVIVEIDSSQVTILNQELRRQLSLTTADLRFTDYVVNTVLEHNGEDGFSHTGWEGGEEWIRAQFKLYLLSLLATCADDRPLAEHALGDFNDNFISAWKVTHNHRVWRSQEHAGIDHVHTRHLCHGQLSINDMKIRWNSAMQNSERGKNLNQVINRTSVAMTNTGRAVGEALTSAKSVMSTWLFGFGGDDDDDQWTYEQE